jgi:hypothetical protein
MASLHLPAPEQAVRDSLCSAAAAGALGTRSGALPEEAHALARLAFTAQDAEPGT